MDKVLAKTPPKQLPKLIDMIIKRFPVLDRNQAWKLIVKVRKINGGVLRGLRMVNFFKIVASIVNEEKLIEKTKVTEKDKMKKTCPLCYKKFCDNQARDRHLKKMHSEPTGTLVEEEIKLDQWTNTEVVDDMDNIEQVDKKRIECDQCDKSFVHRTSLIRHIKSHDQDTQSFACEECKFETNRLDSLARHRRLIHYTFCINLDALRESGNDTFDCKMCGRNFGSEDLFETHIVSKACQTGNNSLNINDEGRYQCDLCERSYVHQSDLLKHLHWKHRPGKTFHCEKCDKNFYNQYSLSRHEHKMHGSDGTTVASTSQSKN